jgi:hypothetical protein
MLVSIIKQNNDCGACAHWITPGAVYSLGSVWEGFVAAAAAHIGFLGEHVDENGVGGELEQDMVVF